MFKPPAVSTKLKVLLLLGLMIGALVIIFLVKLLGLSDRLALDGIVLRDARKAWLEDGSPAPPRLVRYTNPSNTFTRIYVSTNTYLVKSRQFKALFVMDSSAYSGKGLLVVSRDGTLLWVDRKTGPRVLRSPEPSDSRSQ